MREVVDKIARGTASPQTQDNTKASAAPKFSKEDGKIDWTRPFAEIERMVRAFQPWPQTFVTLPTAKGEVRVNIAKMTAAPEFSATGKSPGSILCCDGKKGLVVATRDTPARLSLIQPQGKKNMRDTDFLCGTRVIME
jgi:methionyl-tRNA formyltransferase